jgi:pimeloyl-ACP methyl ester carboxylesterase
VSAAISTPQPHWEAIEGTGPHLLLVHGFLTSRAQWQLNLDALREHCRPVLIELWGHARSPSPEDSRSYRPDAYLEVFESIRRAVGAEQWFVCGYSLGAGLSIRYALEHPDRVRGHIFTNSTSGLADAQQVADWKANAQQAAQRLLEGGHAALDRIAVHPRHARRLPKAIYNALLADAEQHDPAGIANTLRWTNPELSMRHRLHENQVPALLVCGRRERRFAPMRDYAAENMTNLEIVDLDAGHGVNMEAADEFNAAVADFIDRNQV